MQRRSDATITHLPLDVQQRDVLLLLALVPPDHRFQPTQAVKGTLLQGVQNEAVVLLCARANTHALPCHLPRGMGVGRVGHALQRLACARRLLKLFGQLAAQWPQSRQSVPQRRQSADSAAATLARGTVAARLLASAAHRGGGLAHALRFCKKDSCIADDSLKPPTCAQSTRSHSA